LLLNVAALWNYRTRSPCPYLFGGIQELPFMFVPSIFAFNWRSSLCTKKHHFRDNFVILCVSLSNYTLVFKYVAKKKTSLVNLHSQLPQYSARLFWERYSAVYMLGLSCDWSVVSAAISPDRAI
jgi:hypothetical protein